MGELYFAVHRMHSTICQRPVSSDIYIGNWQVLFWTHGRVVQEQFNRSRCCWGGADSCRSNDGVKIGRIHLQPWRVTWWRFGIIHMS